MRPRWTGVGLLLAVLALAGPPASAGDDDAPATPEQIGPLPNWQHSLEAALALAKDRGCAVMVALNMDGEGGNQRMVDEVYRQPVVRDAAEVCVLAIASLAEHTETREAASARAVCSRFGSVTCAEHQALEKVVREDWLKRGPQDDIESPRHFFLAPDGRILFQRTWTVSAEELAAMMRRASELCTPETLAAWDTLDGLLARAVDPLPYLRQTALQELLAKHDADVDARVVALAEKSKDAAVRCEIVSALVAQEDTTQWQLALPFLEDKELRVRIRTAYSLEMRKEEGAIAVLLARASKEREENVRGALYRALGSCGAGKEAVRDALLKAARKKGGAAAHAVVALAPWATDAGVFDVIAKMPWGKHDDDVRKAACWVLGLSGHTELAERLTELATEDRDLEYVATMAAEHLAGGDAEDRYRSAASWIVRHPVYDD